MSTILVRAARIGDARALARLRTSIAIAEGDDDRPTADDSRHLIASAGAHMRQQVDLFHESHSSEVVAWSAVTLLGGPSTHRLQIAGGVDPRFRGHGIGSHVLEHQLLTASRLHSEEVGCGAPSGGCVARAASLVGSDAVRLFKSSMRFVGESSEYATRALSPSRGPTTSLRAFTDLDQTALANLRDLHNDAYSNYRGATHWEPNPWRNVVLGHPRLIREISFAAFDPDETTVLGYCLVYREDSPSGDVAYIGHLGVHSGFRRQGLASGLVVEVVRAARQQGLSGTTAAVDHAETPQVAALLTNLGFREVKRYAHFELAVP